MSDTLTACPVARAELRVAEVDCSPAVDSVELVNTAATHGIIASRKLKKLCLTLVRISSQETYRNLHLHTGINFLEWDFESSRAALDFIATVIEAD